MSDLGNNVLCERTVLPAVTATNEYRDFVFKTLMPEMRRAGMIEDEKFADFLRYAIKEASQKIGIEPVEMRKKSAGRPPKQS